MEAQGISRTAARSVTVIPPTINPLTHLSRVAVQKRRVTGYARVSTDSDEQFTSYEAQELDALTEFDEKLWLTIIDTVTVHADGRMTFKFQGGKTLTSY